MRDDCRPLRGILQPPTRSWEASPAPSLPAALRGGRAQPPLVLLRWSDATGPITRGSLQPLPGQTDATSILKVQTSPASYYLQFATPDVSA
jgi:hypothetical protein